jgi:hypothetical protein
LLALSAQVVAPATWAQGGDQPDIMQIAEPGTQIEVQFAPRFNARFQADAQAWVKRSARAVAGYLGQFPVPTLEILLEPQGDAGVISGVSFGDPSALIRIRVGKNTSALQFEQDWVLVHEMLHMAVPQLARRHRWLHEGIATYCEGVARCRAGLVTPAALWGGFARGMGNGLPQAGDKGLDNTPTWGRTYWGGALFCLLAELALRQDTVGDKGLREALQALRTAGGNYTVAWPVQRIFQTMDDALGVTSLTTLYAQLKDTPVAVDLPALWRKLGVQLQADGSAKFDDSAEQTSQRRAITM